MRLGEIADLLDKIDQQPDLVAKWAEFRSGTALDGTEFVVTQGHTD
ncbi:hypothetical protein GCM10009760_56560 [Kitasatospora kazusensis]|uniref:Uncharacterized protein n=1 Tax=Kitasatospora kazusensis TaxID=407974 RepID=A0ABN3A892_9ACTN